MTEKQTPKRENMFLNILLNIIIPTLILTKFSGVDQLGPKFSIVVALSFPIIYGVKDYFRAGKVNFFSALGVFSVMMTGGMSLLEIPPNYIAIKEAAIPAFIGLAVLISLKTRFPLVKKFLYNDMVMATDKIEKALDEHGNQDKFEQTLVYASWMLAGSFLISSVLNYILARMVLVSPPGTEEFTQELGRMTALSFPVIALPAMVIMMFALFYLFRNIKKLTELDFEDIIQQPE